MVAKFIEVGRDKKSWDLVIDPERDLYNQMYRAVKKNGAVMSSEIDFIFQDAGQTKGAVCVGGFREVGRFELVQA